MNTHHHFDHSGGLRTCVAEGAADVVRDLVFAVVNQKYVVSDGTRTLDVYPVQGLGHAATMLVAYLPKERFW